MKFKSKYRRNILTETTWVTDFAHHAFKLLDITPVPFYETGAAHAVAFVNNQGKRHIAYNPERLGTLHAIDPDLAAVVILQAIGHYDNSFWNGENGRSKANEVYAFRLAGWLAEQIGCDFDTCRLVFDMPRFRDKDQDYDIIRQAAFRSGWLESSAPLRR